MLFVLNMASPAKDWSWFMIHIVFVNPTCLGYMKAGSGYTCNVNSEPMAMGICQLQYKMIYWLLL